MLVTVKHAVIYTEQTRHPYYLTKFLYMAYGPCGSSLMNPNSNKTTRTGTRTIKHKVKKLS
jgi:hypothetical protein